MRLHKHIKRDLISAIAKSTGATKWLVYMSSAVSLISGNDIAASGELIVEALATKLYLPDDEFMQKFMIDFHKEMK